MSIKKINDTVNYENLHIVQTGFVALEAESDSTYPMFTKTVYHNLGYVPASMVFWDGAAGSRDPSSVTANEYNGHPLPRIAATGGGGTSIQPQISFVADYSINTEAILFNVQYYQDINDDAMTHFFKYYIFSQTSLQ